MRFTGDLTIKHSTVSYGFFLTLFFSFNLLFAQTDYEAESATLGGKANISTEHAGYSGTGYVQGYDAGNIGASTSFTISAASAGYYDVTLRYGNGYGVSSISVYVNAVKTTVTQLPSTGSWTVWATKKETFYLKNGSNIIAYIYDSGDFARINLDKITVAPTSDSKPDLLIGDIQWTPATPKEGDGVLFSAIIQNMGNSASPTINHKVSFTILGQQVAVSTNQTAAIAAGSSATATAATTWTAAHGTYSVLAIVDPDTAIPEFNENNNTFTKQITLSQLPGADLLVQSISWTPTNPSAGSPVSFKVTVQNQGLNATAANIVAVRLVVNSAQTLTGTLANALAAGESATISLGGSWTAANGKVVFVATVDPQNVVAESFEGNNDKTQSFYIGRGAQVPWIEYQAEDGILAGGAKVVGPSRVYGTPAGEASGRMAVALEQTNASVAWIASASANSIVIRNCIPDAPAGGGIDAPIGLYINGVHKADIILSSKHSWLYGKDNDPQTDVPSNGQARKIYDESHLLFKGFSIAAGDTVMLRKEAANTAAYCYIDFIDLEQVGAPLPMPAGYISIMDSGQTWKAAIPDDSIADDNALYMCMTQAQSGKYKGVYIPPGIFIQNQKQQPNHCKIQGAGIWYSMLYCPDKGEGDWGTTGFIVNGDSCEFRDFSLFGWGGTRTQGGKAFCNSARKDMTIERLWIEHVSCAYWVGGGNESTNLHVKDCRIRNTGADGINLCNGSANCIIDNCHARNTGDDCFAIWSATDGYGHPCTNNIIRNCTAEFPWRAACFAIYGGTGNRIENCVGADAVTYPGLTIGSEFNPWPMVSATVDGLTLYRCGNHYFTGYDYEGDFGAVWLRADQNPTNGITLKNIDIIDPTYAGIQIQGTGTFTNLLMENITISNPTTYGTEVKTGSSGSATFRNVKVVSNSYNVPELSNKSSTFTITVEDVGVVQKIPAVKRLTAAVSQSGSRVLIDFFIPKVNGQEQSLVEISVFQVNGRQAARFASGFSAGNHRATIDRNSNCQAAGRYIVAVKNAGTKLYFPVTFK
jgi:hypothetical protein